MLEDSSDPIESTAVATVSEVTNTPSSGLNHIDALLDRGPGWNWLTPGRNVLYYTFSLAAPNPHDAQSVTNTGAFNAAQQAAARAVLAYATQITGIVFTATTDADAADLHFSVGNIDGQGTTGLCSTSTSYSFAPVGNTVTAYSSDAWIYLDNVEWFEENNNPAAGTQGYETLLHELGHALGLKHPFEDAVRLPSDKDNTDYTLMSYTHVGGDRSVYSPYDIAALMFLYGGDGLGGALGLGTQGLYLVGSEAGDTLDGGAGNDTFEGKAGNDTINGGANTDTARYSGNRALYTITTVTSGVTVSGPDGIDTLVAVEKLAFADQIVTLAVNPGPNSPPTGTLMIGGTLQQGELLSVVSTLDDANGLGKFSYRWQASRDGTTWSDISGATNVTFTPAEAQVGSRLRVSVSYTDGGGTAESANSAATAVVANLNDTPTGGAFINGTAREDSALTVTNTLADPDGLGTLRWQWQTSSDGSNWADLAGATGTSFTPGDKQVNLRLRVLASWTDGHGTDEVVASLATLAVAGVNDAPTGNVTLSGSAEQGQTLRASNTLADPDGLGSIVYEWQASANNGGTWSAITGASGSSFTPALAQVGQQLRVLARWTDAQGFAEAVPSLATASVLGRVTGTIGADVLNGSGFADRIDGLDGNDRLKGAGGNDQLNGGPGLDSASFARARADYQVGSGGTSVQALAGDEGRDALDGIERLVFSDQSLAFDLAGSAGSTARILGAVFGRDAVANKAYAGIGLSLLDGGMDLNALMQLALDARLGTGFTPEAEVALLFENLVGSAPSPADLGFWVGTLQAGTYTPVSLAWMAANLELNAQNIGLVGLGLQGLPYTP